MRVLSRCLGGRADRSIRVTAAAAVVELGPLGPRTASSPQDRGKVLKLLKVKLECKHCIIAGLGYLTWENSDLGQKDSVPSTTQESPNLVARTISLHPMPAQWKGH